MSNHRTGKNAPLGVPVFTTAHDNTATMNVGDIVHGYDDVLGEGEFIWLPGAAGVLAGDLVVYDLTPSAAAVARTVAATHINSGRPVAVAANDTGVGGYGWFQISGLAVVNAVAGAAVGMPFLTSTPGAVTSTDAAGVEVTGARINSPVGTPSAGKVHMTLNRPSIEPA